MIAGRVWSLIGDPDHYMEPFFGSGAVLLSRKAWEGKTETVCDKDGFLANVWRGIKFAPKEVARWCDWPVNHADLMARRAHLIENEQRLLDGLVSDPKWFDAELAGYWVWAASCWIGSGLTKKNGGEKRPHLGNKGFGVHSTKYCQIPHISNKGKGVTAKTDIYETMRQLSARLRRVRVVCGDFMRILGGDWQTAKWKTVGLFFDPPYGDTDRCTIIYHHDGTDIAERVEKWCLERGKRPDHRIVVAGYDTEYSQLVDSGWATEAWRASGGYGNAGDGRGKANRHRETLFISPHCIKPIKQMDLF